MGTELLTEDMVTQLRAQVQQMAPPSAAHPTGAAQLHAFEETLRQTLNRLGAALTQHYLQAAGRAQEQGPQACPDCGPPMRNVKRAPLTVQSIFAPLRLTRTHFHCSACQRSVYPLDDHYGWGAHRFTSTAKAWVCLMTHQQADASAVEVLGRVSGIAGTVFPCGT